MFLIYIAFSKTFISIKLQIHSECPTRGRVEGSEGGSIPQSYILVRDNQLLNIRSLIPSHFPCLVKLFIYRSIDLSMYLSAISNFCLLNSLDSFTYNPTISILRYICIYGTSEPTATSVPASLPCTQLTTWMARNKMAVMLVGYGLLLLLVGLSNSIWFKRMARKYFYKD